MEKASVTGELAPARPPGSMLCSCCCSSTLSASSPLSILSFTSLLSPLLTRARSIQHPPTNNSFNEREYRYVAEQVWTFERSFDVDAAATLSQAAVDLVITGLDTVADVLLNGEKIARCENAHR